MDDLVLSMVGIAVVVPGVCLSALHRRRRRAKSELEVPPSPRPLVRVLTNDEELRQAVSRAVRFEQMLANTIHTRALRYEAMVSSAPIADISASRGRPAQLPDDAGPRSA